ncbi:LytTR family DNA-binding domain-containing protein [Clostridium sp.]|uniref:LytTR family DNA-binding domain-containing protein n=1 Tax=Clostridium sp. TaxID=1506 RepID=UPI002FC7BF72
MKIDIDINEEYEETIVLIKSPKLNEEVSTLVGKLQSTSCKKIVGKINQKMRILNRDEILVFYSENHKILADTSEVTYEIKQKLYEIEENLKGTSFIRISKFAIANIEKVKEIEVSFNGSLVVNFINGRQEIISRRYVSKVKEYLGIGGK